MLASDLNFQPMSIAFIDETLVLPGLTAATYTITGFTNSGKIPFPLTDPVDVSQDTSRIPYMKFV